ncbi:phosphatase PAP2 family protein [uncultured Dialister sp.]|uniref:phosphatase PAP2 family protein n=1 Tax=uncultured Dialister sp. TaxID=278064 RepID=UPI0026771A32|nr:phosphatase PAP2 family protein [uncultured Dialister sp.]
MITIFALNNFDIGVLYLIQDSLRSPILTSFLEFMTDLGNNGYVWIALAVLLMTIRKCRKAGLTTMLALVINVILANGILKHLVQRPRPFDTYPDLQPLIHEPTDWSFPSGHSSASFAAAFVLYHYMPKKFSIPALILATLIAFSRLYLGVHYPSDVIGGAAIGYLTAWASEKFMTYTEKKTGAKSQNLAHKKKAESA